jgi:NAD(P)-dependent dehydrogenase (short-subunit alcohol dehydrogenase family)
MEGSQMNFNGRVVLVTGSSSGIGYETVKSFALKGAQVVINGTNEDKLNHACTRLKKETNTEILGIIAKVQSSKEVERMVNTVIDRFGHIDILVNNTGIYPTCEVRNMTEEEWDMVMDINAKGPFLVCKAVINI